MLRSYITADGPWFHIQIDHLCSSSQSSDGYTALLVIIDVFTSFADPACLSSLPMLMSSLESSGLSSVPFGMPKIIQSDNGP